MHPLPVPPPDLMYLATAGTDEGVFLKTGSVDQAHVVAAIERALPNRTALRVLDWGCGCGRIARHWASDQHVELFGCDVAEVPVRWCQEHLPFGSFAVSRHDPPLPYPDSFFDVIYAASVLTHLTLESEFRWMQEICRVLKPSGLAMLTAHGPSLLPKILPNMAANTQRTTFTLIDEEMFLCIEDTVGSNATGSIQSLGATERIFFPFSMLEYRPRFGFMGIQDTYLLQKKRDSEVVIRDDVTSAALTGQSFQTSFELDQRGASSLCVLAGIADLTHPARATVRVGDCVSQPASLAQMVKWTGLIGAYSSLVLNDFPVRPGPTAIEIAVTSPKPLDGFVLNLPKLIAF